MSRLLRYLLCICATTTLVASANIAFTATITVDDDGPADFSNIQAAINAASDGDTILIEDGIYRGDPEFAIDTLGKAVTIKSINGPENCIIDRGLSHDENAGFYIHRGELLDTVISGITIIKAYDHGHGGAFYIVNSSPLIDNCIFKYNASYGGGAIEARNSNFVIKNCIFYQNRGGYGTVILTYNGKPNIINCTFVDNRSGGGLYLIYTAGDSELTIVNSIFWNNSGYSIDEIGPNHANIYNSIIDQNIYTGINGNFNSNPLVVNISESDFHLLPGSPCIDAGTSDILPLPSTDFDGKPRVIGTAPDIGAYEFGQPNNPPAADAGVNLSISSDSQSITLLEGTASDVDGDVVTYMWLEGTEELSTWTAVGANGEAYLDLGTLPYFTIGQHTLTLEVNDGQVTASDTMILTIENAAPNAAPSGAGVYEIFAPVTLGGEVSDFDGDMLDYEWIEGSQALFTGQVATVQGGDPVILPEHVISDLALGTHTLTLSVNDGINESVTADITVQIIDTTAPTLVPVANKTILWPPNHKMVDIVIEANASDNTGGAVTISVEVASNEAEATGEEDDLSPDWTEPSIDQETGTIYMQLRAERLGSGGGRVYTVTITATDDSGNSSSTQVEIIVPHDKGKK